MITFKRLFFALLFIILTQTVFAEDSPKPISGDKAFEFSIKATNNETIVAEWNIAPNHYLYRDRIYFSLKDHTQGVLGNSILPAGTIKEDEYMGKTTVYQNHVSISIPIMTHTKDPVQLLVSYQGCSSGGYCYPPITKLAELDLQSHFGHALKGTTVENTSPEEPVAPYSDQDEIQDLLASHAVITILLSFLGIGVLLAFTPCVLPMVPIITTIIVGQKNIHTWKGFRLSLVYVLSMSLTYAVAGLLVGAVGSSIQVIFQQPWIIVLSAIIFVILALSFFGFYDIKLPEKFESTLTKISNHQKSGSYIGVAVMGCLATLILSPCVTPALVGALGYIGDTGDAWLGSVALFSLGFGMGLPLIVIGTAGGKILPKAGHWMESIKSFFGVLMLAMAIYMLSRILPPTITLLLWGALLVIVSMYLGTFTPVSENKWARLRKGVGILMLVYGLMMLVGAGFGNDDPIRPLSNLGHPNITLGTTSNKVETVKNLTDVRRELAKSRAKGKFLLLDFYADWCTSCSSMEKHTFQDPDVEKLLREFTFVRADVTHNDATDKALETYFNVIAPPTILFFGPECRELKQYRVVGEMNAQKFKALLEMILADEELNKKQAQQKDKDDDGKICI
ncbi:MAG: protein-disulfide reductase DsbD [Gammaproteobacteria bacterium]|nr:protein-disulfide reductase DsbD [Gammaproteobacteria bacterium]